MGVLVESGWEKLKGITLQVYVEYWVHIVQCLQVCVSNMLRNGQVVAGNYYHCGCMLIELIVIGL